MEKIGLRKPKIDDKMIPRKLMINEHENICVGFYWKKSMFLAENCQGDQMTQSA